MKRNRNFRIPTPLVAAVVAASCSIAAIGGAAAEPVLDLAVPKDVTVQLAVSAEDFATTQPLAQFAFDVDSDGYPMFADGAAIKLFGSRKEFFSAGLLKIDDFAWMRNDGLLLIVQGHLASPSETGIALGPALPGPAMRVRPAGAETAYIYGGTGEASNRDVYLLARDQKVLKLASLPTPVASVAGDGITNFVATDRMILRITLNERPQLVLQTSEPLISLDMAANGGLFYATQSAVGYLGKGGGAYEFIRGDGGLVRVRGANVFVLMTGGKLLRLGPVEKFESIPAATAAVNSDLPSGRDNEKVGDIRFVQEIKERLYELNYDPGFASADIDDNTRGAIRDFEQANKRPAIGEATYGLLKELRATASRTIWGSIVYDNDLSKYGMAWGHPSRKASVQSAQERCGVDANCTIEVSFSGGECGAFAYSGGGWSLVTRRNNEWAREAALAECRKRDKSCSILAAVCADGSQRYVMGSGQ